MYDNGYVKMYRKLKNWGWYKDSVVKDVFLHLLIIANWEESNFLNFVLKPGDCVVSIKALSDELGFSQQQVRTALKKLESTGEISKKSTNKFTLITVENWGNYQGDMPNRNKRITNKQQTSNKRITNEQQHIKNNKKNKNIKNKKKKSPQTQRKLAPKEEII